MVFIFVKPQRGLKSESENVERSKLVRKKEGEGESKREIEREREREIEARYTEVKVGHYLLFVFSPPKISKTI